MPCRRRTFGVAFLALGAMAFRTGCGALLLVTRPDLVFPRTTGALASTAGAYNGISHDRDSRLHGRHTAVGAFGLRTLAAVFAFALVAVFLTGAAFFAVVVFFGAAAFLAAGAFLVVAAFLVAAVFFAAAGLDSVVLGAASFTGPEVPGNGDEVSDVVMGCQEIGQVA